MELVGAHVKEWVVKATGSGVGLSNLTIVGFWKRRPSVIVSGGDVSLESCHVTGGIRLESNARGEVRRCSIVGLNMPSLIIVDEASPHIVGNEVTGGGEGGLYIAGNSYPLIEDNEIFGNAEAGVWVSGGSLPVLCNNRIHDNNGNGIRIEGTACPTIEGNEVRDNVDSNICAADRSAPVLEVAYLTSYSDCD